MTVRVTSSLGSGVTAAIASGMQWASGVFYPQYMDAIYMGLVYRSNTAHTSAASFSDDAANWTPLTTQQSLQARGGLQGAARGDSATAPTIRSVITLDGASNEFTFNGRFRSVDPAVRSTIIRNTGVNNLDVLLGTYTDSFNNPGSVTYTALAPGQEIMFGANQYAKFLRPSTTGNAMRVEIDVELAVKP